MLQIGDLNLTKLYSEVVVSPRVRCGYLFPFNVFSPVLVDAVWFFFLNMHQSFFKQMSEVLINCHFLKLIYCFLDHVASISFIFGRVHVGWPTAAIDPSTQTLDPWRRLRWGRVFGHRQTPRGPGRIWKSGNKCVNLDQLSSSICWTYWHT